MDNELNWVDVPGYENEYKVALYKNSVIVFTKRKNRAMRVNTYYTLSKDGKQAIFSGAKLKKMCGLA